MVSYIDTSGVERYVINNTYKIQLLAKDYFTFSLKDAERVTHDMTKYLVKFVMPHNDKVEELISKAVNYHPKNILLGYQGIDVYYITYITLDKAPYYNQDPFGGNADIDFDVYINGHFVKSSGEYSDVNSYYFPISLSINYHLFNKDDYIYIKVYDIDYDANDYLGSTEKGSLKDLGNNGDPNAFTITSLDNSIKATVHVVNDVYLQARAIFNALKTYDINYSSSTISFPNENTQRIRLPEEVLELGEANCIDGTLLWASALENIGIDPIIFLIPGHAFVGFYNDSAHTSITAIETTLMGSTDNFSELVEKGMEEYEQYKNYFNYYDGYIKLDVSRIREEGIIPLAKELIQ